MEDPELFKTDNPNTLMYILARKKRLVLAIGSESMGVYDISSGNDYKRVCATKKNASSGKWMSTLGLKTYRYIDNLEEMNPLVFAMAWLAKQ